MLENFFLDTSRLTFLALLIPIILLYLIRPKPKRKTIPSLMFFLKDSGKNRINKIFRKFFRDPLMILHLLIVLFLAISLARPYIELPQSVFVQDTIIIIDVSASTQVNSRWDEIQDIALDSVADSNTIILAQGFPEMIGEGVSASQAKRLIRGLDPKDTTTNLADSIKLAQQYASANTNIIIISDFLPSEGGTDLAPYLEAIRSKGAIVTEQIVGEPVENVGIIDLAAGDEQSRVWVKNFADRPAEVTLKIGDISEELLLAKRETKELQFQTPSGVLEIEIEEKDDFMLDNKAYISAPTDNTVDMLVFTNKQSQFESSNLKIALDLIDKNFPINLNIQYAVPPKVPDLNHDIYLFYEVNPTFILPGYIKDLKEKVEDGAAFIITQQDNLFSLDFQGLMPVEYLEQGTSAEVVAKERNLLTNDVSFGQVQSYTKVRANEGVTVIAEAQGNPLITMNKVGLGTVVYYGYSNNKESFSVENTFPIFWRRLLDFVTNRPTMRSINVETGTLLTFPKETNVKTPTGKITTNLLRVEHSGLYVLPDRTIAANLLSDLESNVNRESNTEISESQELEAEEKKLPKELSNIAIIIGLILLLLELVFIKLRGDI